MANCSKFITDAKIHGFREFRELMIMSCGRLEFQKRLEEDTLAGSPELLQRTVRKMLIIMPESCFCPPQFSEDGKIEHTNKFVVRVAHRAGNVHRDYKSSFYKIIDQTVVILM